MTTGLLETLPENKPIYFLGAWCLSYGRRGLIKDLDYEIGPYHWSDRSKLKRDFELLDEYYEQELISLAEVLNKRHGTDYSLRYWRILVGPWLGYFTHILFDRWTMLQVAIGTGHVDSVAVVDRGLSELIPQDMSEFLGFIVGDDWNEMIYAELISSIYQGKINIEKVTLSNSVEARQFELIKGCKRKVGGFFRSVGSAVLSCFVSDREYFFKSTTFSKRTLIAIQLRLGYIPKFWRSRNIKTLIRSKISRPAIKVLPRFDFKAILQEMVQRHIPVAYLEGHENLVRSVNMLPWPSLPSAIFTHVAWESDDVFKAWAAAKTELECPLVIGQHGGHYGIGLFSFSANHEISIADKYLTWGWSDSSVEHVAKSVASKSWPKDLSYNVAGEAIVLLGLSPRYSTYLWSAPISSQWQNYLEDQISFLKYLPLHIRPQTRVRLYPTDYGWCSEKRLVDAMPDLKIDIGDEKIDKVISKCRVVISTYNATTYLESMSRNIPTIIFWNPEFWEVNDRAEPYFDLLSSVGIFHKTPESAADKVSEIWNDIDVWWWSPSVQAAREKFCNEFVVLSENMADDFIPEITDLIPRI